MRELFKRIKNRVRAKAQSFVARVYSDLYMKTAQARTMLAANSGENFVCRITIDTLQIEKKE